jgi:transposase
MPAELKKNEEALGKSRGGMTTKIHAVTDGLGRCIDFTLTEGQIHDCVQAEALLEGKNPENVLADKGYDSDAVRACVKKIGANPVIPGRTCRKAPIEYDTHVYKERHLVENFFQFIKRFRRVGTRYEMTAQNYFGMVTIACILQWLIF